MRVVFAEPFLRCFKKLSEDTKKKFEKQLTFLLRDIRHPSLRVKKYNEKQNVWQARVNSSYRFYFKIEKERYIILNILKHPK